MAKSARSRQIKTNNRKLKENVFGPVEAARAERLSAKLLEIASQPKPQKDVEMAVTDETVENQDSAPTEKDEAMEIDSGSKPASKPVVSKKRIEKRRSKKSSIVFPKYGERKSIRKKK